VEEWCSELPWFYTYCMVQMATVALGTNHSIEVFQRKFIGIYAGLINNPPNPPDSLKDLSFCV
jgi:hypothetical protein